MEYLYPLFEDKTGRNPWLKAIFSSEEKALEALNLIPHNDVIEYIVEEWPADQSANRWNIRVVATK